MDGWKWNNGRIFAWATWKDFIFSWQPIKGTDWFISEYVLYSTHEWKPESQLCWRYLRTETICLRRELLSELFLWSINNPKGYIGNAQYWKSLGSLSKEQKKNHPKPFIFSKGKGAHFFTFNYHIMKMSPRHHQSRLKLINPQAHFSPCCWPVYFSL